MKSDATTPGAYLAGLDAERRAVVAAVRETVVDNLQPGFEEGIEFGMLSYHVPLERFPDTYNGRPLGLAALAGQKNYVSLYLMSVYGDGEEESRFRDAWLATGRKLDMGRSCVRFKRLEQVALDVVAAAIARSSVESVIARHQRHHG